MNKQLLLYKLEAVMESYGESKTTISYVLLSVNMMNTSNCEYWQWFHDIKISMNAYKYQKF